MDRFCSIDGMLWFKKSLVNAMALSLITHSLPLGNQKNLFDIRLLKCLELAPNTPDLTHELTNKYKFKQVKLLFFNAMLSI